MPLHLRGANSQHKGQLHAEAPFSAAGLLLFAIQYEQCPYQTERRCQFIEPILPAVPCYLQYQRFQSHEVDVLPDILQTLVTGSALTEHMEEFYLDTLRALATTEASLSGIASKVQENIGKEF